MLRKGLKVTMRTLILSVDTEHNGSHPSAVVAVDSGMQHLIPICIRSIYILKEKKNPFFFFLLFQIVCAELFY